MNQDLYLVVAKGEDITDRVVSCRYNKLTRKWDITFKGGKSYSYIYPNVEKLYKPDKVFIPTKEIIHVQGERVFGITKILYFQYYVKVFLNDNNTRLIKKHEISIELNNGAKNRDIFQYLSDIASVLKIEIDEDESFLKKQYSRISSINPESVLNSILRKKYRFAQDYTDALIFPFGFNVSQATAVRNALENKISIIEGPPGTGKTQTILNIIANLVIKDKTIAVVSNNNSATVNVQEKLDKYGVGFISAFLGSMENKEKFIEQQNGIYPELAYDTYSKESISRMKSKLKSRMKQLVDLYSAKNKQAKEKMELDSLEIEYKYFKETIDENTLYKLSPKLSVNKMRGLLRLLEKTKKINWYTRLRLFFKLKYLIRKQFDNVNTLIDSVNHNLYIRRMRDLKESIGFLKKRLMVSNLDLEMKRYSEESMKLLKQYLVSRYDTSEMRTVFQGDDIFFNFDDFVKEYPVVLSTTHSIRNVSANEFLFDYVIVDESSQVDIVSGALALSMGKNVVIVGDEKQLPNVVTKEIEKVTDSIYFQYEINSAYMYSRNSLLSNIKSIYREYVPKTLLREHYRCSPEIINFCNQKFYNNELIIHTKLKIDNPIEVFLSVEGNHARGHFNQRQIDIITNEVLPTLESNNLGVITPFREMRDRLLEISNNEIEVDTVHKFQGRERDVIIISTVSNEIDKDSFVDNDNLINVAISRAKDKLIMVTSHETTIRKNSNIWDFVNYVKYREHKVHESSVRSIFDALYNDRELTIQEISEYRSENIAYNALKQILLDSKHNNKGIKFGYPLRYLVKDNDKLSEREIEFKNNHLTHVDFLVYNKINKQPVFVVEVDGYKYHSDPKQKERDGLKDNILNVSNIPILRLNTTGSNEQKKIEQMMNRI